MDFKQAKRNRKFDHWIIISLLCSLVLGLNFLVSKVEMQVDLTPDSKYSLSKESLALLDKMQNPIDIVITLKDENRLPKIIQKLLHDLNLLLDSFEYAQSSRPIRVYRVDVDSPKAPFGLLERYKISEPNLIVVATPKGGKKTIFRYDEFDGTNPYDLSQSFRSRDAQARQAIFESGFYAEWKESGRGLLEPTKFRGEATIMKAILELTSKPDQRRVAYFTRGHGEKSPADVSVEKGYSEFRTMLEDRNLDVSTIDLSLMNTLPEDAKFVIIADPKGTFQDKEISMLRKFLNQENGRILVAIDPVEEISMLDRPAFGLRPLLKEWGIRCHDMIIHDPTRENFDIFSGSYSLRTYSKDQSHPVVKQLMAQEMSIQTDQSRPVEIERKQDGDFLLNELIYSSKTSWALSKWREREKPLKKNALLDLDGPVPVIAISQKRKRPNYQRFDTNEGKLAVIGCSGILANQFLKKYSSNQLLGQNLINWLKGSEELLDIPPKSLNEFNISMTASEFEQWLYSLAIVPASIALLGIFVGWLRKEL